MITLSMLNFMDECPTREKIINFIKRSGSLTVEELSRHIGITPMGVRQHLMSLEKKGMIRYDIKKHGIGRPVFLYRLTDKAEDMFPKAYGIFVLSLLRSIEEADGRDKVDMLFKLRKEHLLFDWKETLRDKKTFKEKVHALRDYLNTEGYMAELKETDKAFILKDFNCPLSEIAPHYKELCDYELEMFKELLGRNVAKTHCIAQGDQFCSYNIPKT
jgi:predicted ArsR family transcriptional regulator